MHVGSIRGQRIAAIGDGGEFADIQFDQRHRILGDITCVSHDERDRLAHI